MLKAKKKIARREIEQDDVIAFYQKAQSFYDVNRKNISYALVALVVLVIGGYVYFHRQQTNNEIAATDLGKVFQIYDKGNSDLQQFKAAIDGQPQKGVVGLQKIVDDFGSTDNGELARFYLANAEFNLGRYDDALKNFEKFSSGDRVISAAAEAGIAGCLEAKKSFSDAGSHYEKAAGIAADTYNSPAYLNDAARAFAAAGEKEKAVALYQRLKKEYPTSESARDADRFLAQLS